MRGVVYGRQSKTKGESESRENQDEACTRTAELHGVEVVAHLIEPPSTGAYRGRGHRRPKWPTLLEMIRTGQANVVVAYQTNRLSRGGGPGWAPLIEAAEAADLDPDHFVLIANNGFMSEFELGIRASMDREESKKKSENLCDMKERMAKAGKPSGGGLRPFGFEDDRVTVVEAEAAMIRQAAERIASGGTLAAICREWNDQGLVSGRGKPWRVSPLRNILTNPRVAGLRTHNLDEHGRPVVVADATWPAILDRSTFDRV